MNERKWQGRLSLFQDRQLNRSNGNYLCPKVEVGPFWLTPGP